MFKDHSVMICGGKAWQYWAECKTCGSMSDEFEDSLTADDWARREAYRKYKAMWNLDKVGV